MHQGEKFASTFYKVLTIIWEDLENMRVVSYSCVLHVQSRYNATRKASYVSCQIFSQMFQSNFKSKERNHETEIFHLKSPLKDDVIQLNQINSF